jgi:hypothetical protein
MDVVVEKRDVIFGHYLLTSSIDFSFFLKKYLVESYTYNG